MAHLIFVCKYRKKPLNNLGDEMKDILFTIAKKYDITIIEMEVDENHIHFLVQYEPKISILEIVRLLKQISTYRIWKNQGDFLKKHFWKEKHFWSDGYFACSIGNVSKETQ